MRSKPQWQLKLLEGGKPFRVRIEQLMVVHLACQPRTNGNVQASR
jgi:hypothetical protein